MPFHHLPIDTFASISLNGPGAQRIINPGRAESPRRIKAYSVPWTRLWLFSSNLVVEFLERAPESPLRPILPVPSIARRQTIGSID
jgi:hypothetical protein